MLILASFVFESLVFSWPQEPGVLQVELLSPQH